MGAALALANSSAVSWPRQGGLAAAGTAALLFDVILGKFYPRRGL